MSDELWQAATEHDFVVGVRDGTVEAAAAFDRWLVQDAYFVADLLNFQALLLARSPRPAQAPLAAGCVGLVAELAWFESHAAGRGLDLAAPRAAATDDYAGLLDRLDADPVPVALTALWTIEQVYLDAWTFARGDGTGPYAEFVAHWTEPAFAAYVAELRGLVDPAAHRETVAAVLRCELAFWDTALG